MLILKIIVIAKRFFPPKMLHNSCVSWGHEFQQFDQMQLSETLFTPQHCLLLCVGNAALQQHDREDKASFNGRPQHKLPKEVTRLAQMTASRFYPSHLLCNLRYKHTASRPTQLWQTIALFSGLVLFLCNTKFFKKTKHIKRSAKMSGGHGLHISNLLAQDEHHA